MGNMTINNEKQESVIQTPAMEGSFSNVANPTEVTPEVVPVVTSLPEAPENTIVSEAVSENSFPIETEVPATEAPIVVIGYSLSGTGSDQQEIAFQHATGIELDSNQA